MSIGNTTKGIALGVMSLAALDLFVGTKNGPNVFGTVVTAPTGWLSSWLDPAKPLIPDVTGFTTGGSGSSGGGGSGGSTAPNCSGLNGLGKLLCEQTSATANSSIPAPSSLPPATPVPTSPPINGIPT